MKVRKHTDKHIAGSERSTVMRMKKKSFIVFALALAMIFTAAACQAEIIPPHGEGQIGYQAAILCERLTLREAPGDHAGILDELHYGDFIIVTKQSDGWAEVMRSDDEEAGPAGWINAEYIVIDPAWYLTTGNTPVYAWNDAAAPKVGLLDPGTTLPILKEEGDWLIVSLRGATGWIRK